jgi:hypothetical protein
MEFAPGQAWPHLALIVARRRDCRTQSWPTLRPEHFGLQALEKSLDHGVVVAVPRAGNEHPAKKPTEKSAI